jgi:Mrr restriction endonuclease-like protein
MLIIELSDQTGKRLLRQAESFEDSPETVIERLLDQAEREPAGTHKLNMSQDRGTEGELLPEGEYWLPILELLAEAEGKARGSDVIAALEGRLGNRLTPRDRDVLRMGEVRWQNRARFARLRMKERGLISSDSPRGIWEITDRGRVFLEAERGNGVSRRDTR